MAPADAWDLGRQLGCHIEVPSCRLVDLPCDVHSVPVLVLLAADLCPTSTSRRRSLLVVPTTVKKCCPDLGTGQTCKFATGSSVGVCCTTGEDM